MPGRWGGDVDSIVTQPRNVPVSLHDFECRRDVQRGSACTWVTIANFWITAFGAFQAGGATTFLPGMDRNGP